MRNYTEEFLSVSTRATLEKDEMLSVIDIFCEDIQNGLNMLLSPEAFNACRQTKDQTYASQLYTVASNIWRIEHFIVDDFYPIQHNLKFGCINILNNDEIENHLRKTTTPDVSLKPMLEYLQIEGQTFGGTPYVRIDCCGKLHPITFDFVESVFISVLKSIDGQIK